MPPGSNRRSPLADVWQRRRYRRTRLRGIPIGTIDQTIVDLAALLPPKVLARTVDDALVARRSTSRSSKTGSSSAAPRSLRHPGAAVEVVEARSDGTAPTESELERHLHLLLAHPALPRATSKRPLPWRQPASGRADAVIWPWRLIVEADGRRWHARWRAFETDRRRDAEALAAGSARCD
ncbi:MAG: hypothetical protein R2690_20775 [Acidimicrobiales bacterium]